MTDILSLTLSELEEQKEIQPKFRAKQIFRWLHEKKVTDFSEMTDISASLRSELSEKYEIKSLQIKKRLVSKRQDTVKYLYRLSDNEHIETVFMSHKHGNSLCISSQVGCRMGCKFCASGQSGLVRNLTPSEMLLQLYETLRNESKPIDSIVVMGIGEPLDNYNNVLTFLELLQSGHGMSLRHLSLSTCGVADKIDDLAKLRLGLTLSVSLHAVTDSERSEIMPINNKFDLSRLMKSCADYFKATGRRISFEYALIQGVNDSESHAGSLTKLLSRMPRGSCHVNLIPVNEIREAKQEMSPKDGLCSSDGRILTSSKSRFKQSKNAATFAGTLEKSGVNATVRRTMGADIDAACGQLRIRESIN